MDTAVVPAKTELSARAKRVASIAARHADDVDTAGRFPKEAIAALREERLLGIQVPVHLGGEGASLGEIADLCCTLGQSCASTAMIFAMHHIKASSLVEHGEESAWHTKFMRRPPRPHGRWRGPSVAEPRFRSRSEAPLR